MSNKRYKSSGVRGVDIETLKTFLEKWWDKPDLRSTVGALCALLLDILDEYKDTPERRQR
jgi:hypothetical protein